MKRLEQEEEHEDEEEQEEVDMSEEEEEGAPPRATSLGFELLPRRDEKGRWQAESPELRALRHAQLGRGVASSKVSQNIADVLTLVAPDCDVPAPCESEADAQDARRASRASTARTTAARTSSPWLTTSCAPSAR